MILKIKNANPIGLNVSYSFSIFYESVFVQFIKNFSTTLIIKMRKMTEISD